MFLRFSLLAVFFVVFTAALVPTQTNAARTFYSSGAIRAIFHGRFEARVSGMPAMIVTVSRGGGLKVRNAIGIRDQGRWSVKQGQLCMSWRKWTAGRKMCLKVWKAGTWFVASAIGTPAILFRRPRKRIVSR